MDQILLSNSSNSFKNALLNSFSYYYFLNHSIQPKFFYTISVFFFFLLDNLFKKYIVLFAKKNYCHIR